jgi:hypothetical protein
MNEALRRAYEKALYVVAAQPELVIRVGEPNPRLDRLLEERQASTAAYVTASNPRGEERSERENDRANAELSRLAAPYACYPGEGRDPEGRRAAEKSLLIVGIAREEAEQLGRRFDQNAIVFIEKGRAPGLVVLV